MSSSLIVFAWQGTFRRRETASPVRDRMSSGPVTTMIGECPRCLLSGTVPGRGYSDPAHVLCRQEQAGPDTLSTTQVLCPRARPRGQVSKINNNRGRRTLTHISGVGWTRRTRPIAPSRRRWHPRGCGRRWRGRRVRGRGVRGRPRRRRWIRDVVLGVVRLVVRAVEVGRRHVGVLCEALGEGRIVRLGFVWWGWVVCAA